jgi:MFS family permease
MGVSQLGTQIQRVAVAWQLYLLTHSPLKLGLLGLFRVLPVILLALGAGVIADALDRRRLMLVTQSLMALASALLAALTATGHDSVPAIYALTFLAGCANAFDNPARQALIPNLVPRAELAGALSLNITTWQVASVVGPSLGGLLLGMQLPHLGPHLAPVKSGLVLAYAVDALSFLAVIASLVTMRHRAPAASAGRVSFAALGEGLRFLRGQPIIMWLMVLDFLGTFLGGATLLMPIFASEVLGIGPSGLGLLNSAPPLGAVLAALVLSWSSEIKARGPAVLVSVLVYGLAMAGFGLSRHVAWSLFFLAVSGAADTVSTVVRQTVRQLLTPDELRGRMTSINMIFFMGGPQLGEVEAGVVAKWVGAPLSVTLGGLGCALCAALVVLIAPQVRRHRA